MKLYILTIGKNLFYVSKNYEDAAYEKESTEEENWQGRKQCIKLNEVDVDTADENATVTLSNNVEYTVHDILDLL